MGHSAIELAKWGGAEVVTTVSSAEKAELASAADVIVNYREDGAAEQIGKVDRIVEVALGPNLELTSRWPTRTPRSSPTPPTSRRPSSRSARR